MNYFDEIFNRIKNELRFSTDREMYEYMGIIQGTFTNWRRRNSIPYEEINTICINNNLDLNYILNGNKTNLFGKKINYKEEIHKMIDDVKEEKAEIYYHLIKAELLKEKL